MGAEPGGTGAPCSLQPRPSPPLLLQLAVELHSGKRCHGAGTSTQVQQQPGQPRVSGDTGGQVLGTPGQGPPGHFGTPCPVLGALRCPSPCSWVLGLGADAGFPCLSLQENAIGDEGMAALSAALKVNTTLADLQ